MSRKILFLLVFIYSFLFLIQKKSIAQDRSNTIWYFGNGAGLDFSSGKAKLIYNGKIFTLEGCASACDENGKLVFYTDGISVWNRFHKVIQNGEDLNGSASSTQSALIVRQPGMKKKYFLFTTDEKAGKKGLCYSVVDFSSNDGSVTKKNIPLLSSSTEKLTAVQNSNGKDVWVVAHQWNSNNFFVFPVTEKGIGKPVISSSGAIHTETDSGENRETIGYMIASSDGKRIAVAICYRAKNNVEIFDFDKSTGKISHPETLSFNGFPYGLSFSPDNSKLYVSFLKGKSGIVQYSFRDRKITEIIPDEQENSFGALQVAPDGKIYVARTGNYLDVIEMPNEGGISCKYLKNVIDLSPASNNYGLPNFWFSGSEPISLVAKKMDCSSIIEMPFSPKNEFLTTEISICDSEFALNAKNKGATYRWSTGATTQRITVDTSKLYKVTIAEMGCIVKDSIRVKFRKDAASFRYLPVFNPESDFMNSEFYYSLEDVIGFSLKVYDKRRKHILFETNNVNKKWNGKNKKGELVPAGEYFWMVTYTPNCPKGSKLVNKEGIVLVKRNSKK